MKKILKAFNTVTEGIRGAAEWGALKASWSQIRDSAPDGDGHPVLILPGFLADDFYTAPLRDCLTQKGYKIYTWDNGFNLGLNDKTAEHLQAHLEKISAENGGAKVSIVGHSLGGVYARELARENPELVRGVITLGTPFGALGGAEATPALLRTVYEFLNPGSGHLDDEDLQKRGLTPPPVPTTSVYSKQDGIVDWQASINPKSPLAENVEVFSSHLGMIVNPLAVAVILDRLSQRDGDWKPYDTKNNLPAYIAALYPKGIDDQDLPQDPKWDRNATGSKPLFRKKDR